MRLPPLTAYQQDEGQTQPDVIRQTNGHARWGARKKEQSSDARTAWTGPEYTVLTDARHTRPHSLAPFIQNVPNRQTHSWKVNKGLPEARDRVAPANRPACPGVIRI